MHRKLKLLEKINHKFLEPHSKNEDIARREYIFNTLLFGFNILLIVTFLISLARELSSGAGTHHVSPLVLLIPMIFSILMFFLSRRKFREWIVYTFVFLYLLLGTYGLYKYGFVLPQGVLIYVIVIIMSGILVSARVAVVMTGLIVSLISGLAYFQRSGSITPYTAELRDPLAVSDLLVYAIIFMIIFLISWMSTREIEKSLDRARKSERLLIRERNALERTVQKRTLELQKAQVEKTIELYKFAEFGRLSSSLIHDIANPLTTISLSLNELERKQNSKVLKQAKIGLDHMEEYIQSARKQLNNQSEQRIFNTDIEMNRVVRLLDSKARACGIKIITDLGNASIYGDNAKFSQVIANLLANAIDSYNNERLKNRKNIIHLKSLVLHNESQVKISVMDNGSGIRKKDISKIFEPFFTTKSFKRGTGIGLTITKNIVEQDFGGKIYVQSSSKKTEFVVLLPRSV